MTPSFRKEAISLSSKRRSLKISFVCWPRVGGALLIPGWAWEYLMGVFTSLIGPHAEWATSTIIPLA